MAICRELAINLAGGRYTFTFISDEWGEFIEGPRCNGQTLDDTAYEAVRARLYAAAHRDVEQSRRVRGGLFEWRLR